MLIYYRIKLPTLRFQAIGEHYEAVKSSVKQAKAAARSEYTEKTSKTMENNTKSQQIIIHEKESDNKETNVLKSLFKEKLAQKIQQKEDEQTIRQIHINFPKDKPTFSLDLLTKNNNPGASLDEQTLMEKAQAIKNKLAEFDIEVTIE